jgi:tellurite resistance protein TerC
MIASNFQWIVFNVGVILLLCFDLLIYNKKDEVIPIRSAIGMSLFWIALALLFNLYIYLTMGSEKGILFLTGYLVEKSLSVDNLFVFLVIFQKFSIPQKLQHKVLFYGILGALIMRAIFIFGGIALIHAFEPLIYILGVFLIVSGLKLLKESFIKSNGVGEKEEASPLLGWVENKLRRYFDFSDEDNVADFWTRIGGKLKPTKLFLALIVIEISDVIFALDSIPAILVITSDPFIVYTSNICAILGLRALYFALNGLVNLFEYLGHGISIILVFVGSKMLVKPFISIPAELSLVVIGSILGISIIYSIRQTKINT